MGIFLFKREAVVLGSGWNRLLHRGCITIETHSIRAEDLVAITHQIPIPEEDWKRVDIKHFTMELYPVAKEKVRARIVANINPNCWFLPSKFYKFIAKTAADFLINKLYSLSKSAQDQEWGERIRQNPEFYSWIKTIVSAYFSWKDLSDTFST